MKTLNIDWLNTCTNCDDNDYAIVQTEKGHRRWLYDGDHVECPDCGNTGEIECVDDCAQVNWSTSK